MPLNTVPHASETHNSLGHWLANLRTNSSEQPKGWPTWSQCRCHRNRRVLPVDGPLETAPNCEALIPKAKATEGELIRTSRIYAGESQVRSQGSGDSLSGGVIVRMRGVVSSSALATCGGATEAEGEAGVLVLRRGRAGDSSRASAVTPCAVGCVGKSGREGLSGRERAPVLARPRNTSSCARSTDSAGVSTSSRERRRAARAGWRATSCRASRSQSSLGYPHSGALG